MGDLDNKYVGRHPISANLDGTVYLSAQAEAQGRIRRACDALTDLVHAEAASKLHGIARDLAALSPSVTLVGQVKAGKTALANALAGTVGLLPTDVNPWTAVVTNLHLNPEPDRRGSAVFSFFTQSEWDAMVQGGGHVGALARQVSADAELETLRAQTEAVYAKARARLGSNFSMLLGAHHRFSSFDAGLVERYVCMGDEADAEGRRRGRFADVTRAADLHLEAPQYAGAITLRDTPGVNDPFLVREQVTMRCLVDTAVCLVVLSAHQALTTTDLALVRLLTAMDRRQIVLFVNRIDELDDPLAQTGEIETRVRRTLAVRGLAKAVPIVFGSASWAGAALTGALDALPRHGREMLAEVCRAHRLAEEPTPAAAWTASGLPRLQALLAERIERGPGGRALAAAAASVLGHARQARALLASSTAAPGQGGIGPDALFERINPLTQAHSGALERRLDMAETALRRSLEGIVSAFARHEGEKLDAALQRREGHRSWTPDSTVLRGDLSQAYFAFLVGLQDDVQAVFDAMAGDVEALYRDVLGEAAAGVSVTAPQVPVSAAPVAIAAAMTIDMSGRWWTGWFARLRSRAAKVEELVRQIRAESRAILDRLEEENVSRIGREYRHILHDFLEEHCATLYDLVSMDDPEAQAVLRRRLGIAGGPDARAERLDAVAGDLETLLAELSRPETRADAPTREETV